VSGNDFQPTDERHRRVVTVLAIIALVVTIATALVLVKDVLL
jgi:hypothetical protein